MPESEESFVLSDEREVPRSEVREVLWPDKSEDAISDEMYELLVLPAREDESSEDREEYESEESDEPRMEARDESLLDESAEPRTEDKEGSVLGTEISSPASFITLEI